MNLSINEPTIVLIKHFGLPFPSLSPPWAHKSSVSLSPTSGPMLSSLLNPPGAPTPAATDPLNIPSQAPDSSGNTYVTTTNAIIVPITIQGPPEQTVYPIASQGFNYFTSQAPRNVKFRVMIVFCMLFMFGVSQMTI